MSPLWRHYHEFVENVTWVPLMVQIFLPKWAQPPVMLLIETGATRSVMSEKYYQTIMLPQMKHLYNVSVKSASGSNLQPLGLVNCSFCLGPQDFTFHFIVYKKPKQTFNYGIRLFET